MNPDDFPRYFMGGIVITAKERDESVVTSRGLGIAIHMTSMRRSDNRSLIKISGTVEMFVDPPIITLLSAIVGRINTVDLTIEVKSSRSKLFKYEGQFSPDLQVINGSANIRGFQLMDLAGDFVGQAVKFEAHSEPAD